MAKYEDVKLVRTIIGKLEHDGDLIGQLNEIAQENNITLGKVEAIGAVKRANIGFYDQSKFEYRFMELDEPLEITSLIGNISIKDGKPFVHVHINLSDEEGKVFGGHLGARTIVFACEFVMTEYKGAELIRDFDKQTHLPLWKI